MTFPVSVPLSAMNDNWVLRGGAQVGRTYALGRGWFLDFAYTYAQSANFVGVNRKGEADALADALDARCALLGRVERAGSARLRLCPGQCWPRHVAHSGLGVCVRHWARRPRACRASPCGQRCPQMWALPLNSDRTFSCWTQRLPLCRAASCRDHPLNACQANQCRALPSPSRAASVPGSGG
jgi:hypothetical protein